MRRHDGGRGKQETFNSSHDHIPRVSNKITAKEGRISLSIIQRSTFNKQAI